MLKFFKKPTWKTLYLKNYLKEPTHLTTLSILETTKQIKFQSIFEVYMLCILEASNILQVYSIELKKEKYISSL